MRIVRGLNPDFADHDEIDEDIAEAISEFDNGRISYLQLKVNIGPEAARSHVDRMAGPEDIAEYATNLDGLFDNPEDF